MDPPPMVTLHSYVPPLIQAELARRNQTADGLLESWEMKTG
jgi:hypothetical protein